MLHPRQDEALRGVERGLSYEAVAAEMGVSVSTVRTHLWQARKRLPGRTRSEKLSVFRRSRVPAAAVILHGEQGKLTIEGWERVVHVVLDALDEA